MGRTLALEMALEKKWQDTDATFYQGVSGAWELGKLEISFPGIFSNLRFWIWFRSCQLSVLLKSSNWNLSLEQSKAGQETIHIIGSDCGRDMILDLGARGGVLPVQSGPFLIFAEAIHWTTHQWWQGPRDSWGPPRNLKGLWRHKVLAPAQSFWFNRSGIGLEICILTNFQVMLMLPRPPHFRNHWCEPCNTL